MIALGPSSTLAAFRSLAFAPPHPYRPAGAQASPDRRARKRTPVPDAAEAELRYAIPRGGTARDRRYSDGATPWRRLNASANLLGFE